MVDPGEQVSVTLRREFMEEALDSTQASDENIKKMEAMVKDFFASGVEVYKGRGMDLREKKRFEILPFFYLKSSFLKKKNLITLDL